MNRLAFSLPCWSSPIFWLELLHQTVKHKRLIALRRCAILLIESSMVSSADRITLWKNIQAIKMLIFSPQYKPMTNIRSKLFLLLTNHICWHRILKLRCYKACRRYGHYLIGGADCILSLCVSLQCRNNSHLWPNKYFESYWSCWLNDMGCMRITIIWLSSTSSRCRRVAQSDEGKHETARGKKNV